MVKLKKALAMIYSLLIYSFLYIPIIVMIVFSFNDSKYRVDWSGFTFKWYSDLFSNPEMLSVIYTTILVAVLSSVLATIIGTITAIGIDHLKPKYKTLFINLSYIPMISPDIVIGISLLTLFVMIKLPQGMVTLILAHITFNIPYVIFAVLPKLQQLDPHLEEAALDLGATPTQAFWKVVFPEIIPGIFTGALLALTMSLDDFIVSFFTTGSGVTTLSIKIYSMTKRGVSPMINALSSILFMVSIVILLAIQYKQYREDEKKKAEMLLRQGD
ncbi:MAG: ABC transporter permease [Peptostreptococcaceae bacterium]|nr:ABC transporter permease [Peptostreptococcaceae bacterium]